MSKPLFARALITSIIMLMASGHVFAQDTARRAGQDSGDIASGNGPIVITSSRLTADRAGGTAVFEGNVTAKNGDMTIQADAMTVYYAEGGAVRKIDARGNVRLIKRDVLITSEAAEYFTDQRKVVFSQNPRVVQGNNIVAGTRIEYLLGEGKYMVTDSRVILEEQRNQR